MPIRATMMLADAAQASDGKLYILGGGWAITGPEPSPSAIAIHCEISWDMANQKHPWRIELLDSDGEPVMVPTPLGERPLTIEGELEVGRPPGLPPGIGLGVPIAINMGPLPLEPGGRYEWRLSIHGQTDDNWRLPFSIRPRPISGPIPPGGLPFETPPEAT